MIVLDIFETCVTSISWQYWFMETSQINVGTSQKSTHDCLYYCYSCNSKHLTPHTHTHTHAHTHTHTQHTHTHNTNTHAYTHNTYTRTHTQTHTHTHSHVEYSYIMSRAFPESLPLNHFYFWLYFFVVLPYNACWQKCIIRNTLLEAHMHPPTPHVPPQSPHPPPPPKFSTQS